jgi:hypothetical protein
MRAMHAANRTAHRVHALAFALGGAMTTQHTACNLAAGAPDALGGAQSERAPDAARFRAKSAKHRLVREAPTTMPKTQWRSRIPSVIVAGTTAAALAIGWISRDGGYLAPDGGLGYWLGIVGGCAMLLLLLYPLRKRVRWLQAIGSVTAWFRIHMLLGVAGPVLILFHANFKLGSTNSNVALFAMLTVAISGIVGRYIYTKIHLGLYGRRATIDDLLSDVDALRHALGAELPRAEHVLQQLQAFSGGIRRSQKGVASTVAAFATLGLRAARCRRRVLREISGILDTQGRREGWSRRTRIQHRKAARGHVQDYFRAEKRLARFAVFERIFAAWHVLHLPFFFILIIAATLHVVAVHIY